MKCGAVLSAQGIAVFCLLSMYVTCISHPTITMVRALRLVAVQTVRAGTGRLPATGPNAWQRSRTEESALVLPVGYRS